MDAGIADAGDPPANPPPHADPCEILGLPGPPSISIGAGIVRVADVDGDGKLDLVAIDATAIRVSPGHGDTTFGASIESALADLHDAVTAELADVNGDGNVDVVMAASVNTGPAIVVLLGDGTGHFRPTFNRRTFRVLAIAVADLNGDHQPDLVLASPRDSIDDSDVVRVRLGNGDGSFGDDSSYLVGEFPVAVAVADIDGDRIPDVIVANELAASVSLLRGNGDGTFRDKLDLDTARFPGVIIPADMNGDGKIDLVIGGGPEQVELLVNEGGGRLRRFTPTTPPLPGLSFGFEGIAVGDIDRDGKLDVIAVNGVTLFIFAGNGDGTLQQATLASVPAGPPVLGDVSGDGALDVILAVASRVFVVQSDGIGGLFLPIPHSGGRSATAVTAADLNGDGNADLVLYDTSSLIGSVSIALGNGNGGFRDLVDYSLRSETPGSVKVQDVTGDGIVDLVAGFNVLPGNGDGTFREPAAAAPLNRAPFEIGDINGDGKPDLVIGDFDTVVLAAGNGDGTFQAKQLLWHVPTNSGIISLAVGDVNDDGRQDVVVSHHVGCIECSPIGRDGVEVLLNDGGGTFHASFESPLLEGPVALADLDGDGKLDLVTGTRVRRGNGDGTLQTASTNDANDVGNLQILDITGDGKLDIIRGETVVPGNGDGTFGAALSYSYLASAIADVNRDGRLDIITTSGAVDPPGTTFKVTFARCVR